MRTFEQHSNLSKRALRTALRVTVGLTACATIMAAAPAGASTIKGTTTAGSDARTRIVADAPSTKTALGMAGTGAPGPRYVLAPQHAKKTVAGLGQAHATAVLPASVDLTKWAPPAGYQGSVGSCATWAIDYGMLGWYMNYYGRTGSPFAPMYTYSQVKLPGGGSDPKTILANLKSQGNDTQADYWQGNMDDKTLPTAAERANVAHYRIVNWRTVFDGNTAAAERKGLLQQELAQGHPVAIDFHVYSSFTYANVTATNPYYNGAGTAQSYHEVMVLGYDSYGLWIQNSWDKTFGLNGRFHMSWGVVARDVIEAVVISGGLQPSTTTTTTDTTPPVMSGVSRAIGAGYQVRTTVPVTLKWSASDAHGIASYALWTSTNGGAWVDTTSRLSSATATSATLSLVAGSTYKFAVKAVDPAGNSSVYSYTPAFSTAVFDDNQYTTYSTGWTRNVWSSALGGNEVDSATPGATASFRFTGTSVAWVAPMATNRGQAYIYMDGTYVGTTDLYSATLRARTAAYTYTYATAGTHTITVKVVGTAGRPTATIDGFALMG